MICNHGVSEKLSPRTSSDETARLIDAEIRMIVDTANQRSYQILNDNLDVLDRVAQALLERETITGEDPTLIIEGKPLPDLHKAEPRGRFTTPWAWSHHPSPASGLGLGILDPPQNKLVRGDAFGK
jgi:cell division protease FtsH